MLQLSTLSFCEKTLVQVARESDWSLLNHNQTLIRFGKYRNEPWTDRKLQKIFTRIPKSTEEKFFYAHCQSIVQKNEQIQIILNGLRDNTVYGLSKTWLKESNDQKLWELNKDRFKTFRSDRKPGIKTKGGGVMLLIPKTLNPKSRNDLNCMNKNQFESLWVECNFNIDPTKKNRQLINISYNPSKSLIDPFLEELSTSIDIAIVENKPITLMGDFNINFF